MRTNKDMKDFYLNLALVSVLALAVVVSEKVQAQDTSHQPTDKRPATIAGAVNAETTNLQSSPIFVTDMPPGYRDWKLISVAHEEGALTDIRAILGNDIAVNACREGTLPLPEGSIIARIAWSYDESEENNKAFAPFLKQGAQRSFVAGHPTNGVQFMIKDSKKYSATGGWGYGHFNDGKPADRAFMQSCYACHKAIKSRDYVFARYAP
jgi:hypothetical protein